MAYVSTISPSTLKALCIVDVSPFVCHLVIPFRLIVVGRRRHFAQLADYLFSSSHLF